MINRLHLEILRNIANTKNLTQAASNLHLTQSALSHSIKKLEQGLKIKLWEKEGRKLCLTPAGNIVLELANRILPEIEHSETIIKQLSEGKRGSLRIGMECHPCYRWLLRVISPFLASWPDVEIDVKQKFQFNGMSALINHDIDLLITPDPIKKTGITYVPVFPYELVLVFGDKHEFINNTYITPPDLMNETLFTYPVPEQRLDIFSQFLSPKNCTPKRHKTIESTDIMLEMVAAGRGVTVLPAWLIEQYKKLRLHRASLGKKGIHKQIFIGIREKDANIEYLQSFIQIAKNKTLAS